MRLCLPARMGGGGKAESPPLARASGRAATATRGRLFCFGNERAKPLAFPLGQRNGCVSLPQPQRGTEMAPLHGATRTGGVTASRARDKAVARQRSAASRSERASGPRPARREARAPAGQHENAAPLGARSAEQSASLNSPAQLTAALLSSRHAIVTDWPRRQRRLGGASPRRRGCAIERGAGFPAGRTRTRLLAPDLVPRS